MERKYLEGSLESPPSRRQRISQTLARDFWEEVAFLSFTRKFHSPAAPPPPLYMFRLFCEKTFRWLQHRAHPASGTIQFSYRRRFERDTHPSPCVGFFLPREIKKKLLRRVRTFSSRCSFVLCPIFYGKLDSRFLDISRLLPCIFSATICPCEWRLRGNRRSGPKEKPHFRKIMSANSHNV